MAEQFHDCEGNVFEEGISNSENIIDLKSSSRPPSSRISASGILIGVFRIT